MKKRYFGTDGIRGVANKANMNAEVAMRLGVAAGSIFTRGPHQHRVIIGKDTRLSGYLIEPALTAGFISVGMDVILVGPMPTPAIAMLTRSMRADLGVMISASHNPYHDNGIKLFGPDGYKLSDHVELAIEERMHVSDYSLFLSEPDKLGRAKRLDDAPGRYIEFVKNTFPKKRTLEGLKIVIDCANGAGYHLGPTILWELGAEVIPIGVNPDGFNINKDCGSTSPAYLIDHVIKNNADIGIALDGDADRLLIVDEKGQIVDGDQIMAVITRYLLGKRKIKGSGIVATVMSNLGLEKYLNSVGLSLIRAQVGDRYVVEAMKSNVMNIGGEQSGHIVLGDYSTTGDALISALHVLAAIVALNKPASEACKVFESYPQILRNITYEGSFSLDSEEVRKIIREAELQLANKGRILVRKSGTEPLIRIMAEGEDYAQVAKLVDDMVSEIKNII
jgi:phosphoglucosamine mutase